MKKKKIKLNLGKQTISGFDKRRIVGGTFLSQYPDAQSECLCGAPPTVLENTCRDESQCVGSCYRTCSLDDGVPPENF